VRRTTCRSRGRWWARRKQHGATHEPALGDARRLRSPRGEVPTFLLLSETLKLSRRLRAAVTSRSPTLRCRRRGESGRTFIPVERITRLVRRTRNCTVGPILQGAASGAPRRRACATAWSSAPSHRSPTINTRQRERQVPAQEAVAYPLGAPFGLTRIAETRSGRDSDLPTFGALLADRPRDQNCSSRVMAPCFGLGAAARADTLELHAPGAAGVLVDLLFPARRWSFCSEASSSRVALPRIPRERSSSRTQPGQSCRGK